MRLAHGLSWPFTQGVKASLMTFALVVVGCNPVAPGAVGQSASAPGAVGQSTSAPGSVAPGLSAAPGKTSLERYLAGTLSWTAVDPNSSNTVSGRADLVLHFVGGGLWLSERGDGSTYTYDGTYGDCSPDGHLSGVIESGVGGAMEPEWHIGIANVLETDVGDTPDLQVQMQFYDEWDVTCPTSGGSYAAVASLPGLSFPGCAEFGNVRMKNDGTGNYSVACDVATLGYTGHIAGELHPIEGPPATP